MKHIGYSESISSERLNEQFTEMQTLLSKAYGGYYKLKHITKVQDIVIEALGGSMTAASSIAGAFLEKSGFNNESFEGQRVGFDTFWTSPLITSNTQTLSQTGSLTLSTDGEERNRVPLDQNGEVSSLLGISLLSPPSEDPYLRWILEPNRYWAAKFPMNEIQMLITLPLSVYNDVNYILFENIFPEGITHRIEVMNAGGSYESVTSEKSSNFAHNVNGYGNGNSIRVTLKSTLEDGNGNYIFGIKNIEAAQRNYVSSGYAINKVKVNYTDGDFILRTFQPRGTYLSKGVRFEIGTGVSGSDISNVFYDSDINPFPMESSDIALNGGLLQADDSNYYIYVKTYLNRMKNGNTPKVDGFYFEFTQGA